ncbi:hypothetical protein G7Y79_00066g095070 [Physcia stellaris]|nr:hypothetical protein G7Y79_00066g095070 [Physcia stellaris]
MSWNLTKKLKETHLGQQLKNPLGGRSTTSTALKPDENSSIDENASIAASTSSGASNGIVASEAMVSPPAAPTKPGILIVTLHEGKGFALPPHYQQSFGSSQVGSSVSAGSGFGVAGSMRGDPTASRSTGGMAGSYANGRPPTSGINAAPTIHGRYSSRHLPYALLDFDKLQVFVDAVSGSPENPYWPGDNTQYKFDVSRATELSVQLYLRNPNARPGAANFDREFTQEAPADSYVDGPMLSQTMQQQFAGWSYNRPVAGLGDAGGSVKDPSFGSVV